MPTAPLRAAIVGCGNVADSYGKNIASYENIEIAGAFDLDAERAKAFAGEYGGTVYPSLDDLLADEAIDIAVNLTIHHAHYEVITRLIEAGKAVHSEKPLALTYREARELVELADKRNVRLSSAPITYMGECAQTAWKQIRDGRCGKVRLVYSEVNHGRIEAWHPNPKPFYDVGVMFDVGVYPLTIATTFFGPARSLTCSGKVIYPDRTSKDGTAFTPGAPDFMVAVIEFAGGQTMRLTANFYVANSKQGASLEFHGDEGSVIMGNFQSFQAGVEYAAFGQKGFESIPHLREPYHGIEFGRGIEELANAMLEERPHRASGAQAAHVVEIVEAMHTSMREGRAIELESDFPQPEPMDWAR